MPIALAASMPLLPADFNSSKFVILATLPADTEGSASIAFDSSIVLIARDGFVQVEHDAGNRSPGRQFGDVQLLVDRPLADAHQLFGGIFVGGVMVELFAVQLAQLALFVGVRRLLLFVA